MCCELPAPAVFEAVYQVLVCDEKGTVCPQESDGRDKMWTHLDARPASVSVQRLQPGWRRLRVIHFARVGASVKEGWPGGTSWCGGHRALQEEAEGSQGLSPGQGEPA